MIFPGTMPVTQKAGAQALIFRSMRRSRRRPPGLEELNIHASMNWRALRALSGGILAVHEDMAVFVPASFGRLRIPASAGRSGQQMLEKTKPTLRWASCGLAGGLGFEPR